MYYLESEHKIYEYGDAPMFLTLEEALIEYEETIQGMMNSLPKCKWFNLRLWKKRTEDDPVCAKYSRDIIVRSWVY